MNFMSTEEAFEIVFDLAEKNALSGKEVQGDPDLEEAARLQQVALDTVHDFLVNHIYGGDDATL